MEISNNYAKIKKRVEAAALRAGRNPDDIAIVCVSKSVDIEQTKEAVAAGITIIGENRVNDFLNKYEALKDEVKCHFIGHLQTNKVGKIVGRADLIQSLDSVRLAKELSRIALTRDVVVDTLVEVNISGDENKYGIKPDEIEEFLSEISKLPNLRVRGLMAIGPLFGNQEKIRQCFLDMHKLFIDMSTKTYDNIEMDVLSLGMSQDFELAIECGSNLIRVGTAFFKI